MNYNTAVFYFRMMYSHITGTHLTKWVFIVGAKLKCV